jgi:hypothetical protein
VERKGPLPKERAVAKGIEQLLGRGGRPLYCQQPFLCEAKKSQPPTGADLRFRGPLKWAKFKGPFGTEFEMGGLTQTLRPVLLSSGHTA